MTECRKPGNPGGTRRGPNPAPVSTPTSMGNTGGAAPGGEVDRPKTPNTIKAGNRKTVR